MSQSSNSNTLVCQDYPEVIASLDRNEPYECAGYNIYDIIAEGSFGVVYKAKSNDLNEKNCDVAIKSFKHSNNKPSSLQIEMDYLESLKHENIIELRDTVIETFMKENNKCRRYWLVLELCDLDLESLVFDASYTISFNLKLSFMIQCLRAIEYIHGENVMHRDIKLRNILVKSNGVVKLTDFGICCEFDELGAADEDTNVGSDYYRPLGV